MRGLSAGLCLLFLGMPACGVKTDPVPYVQTAPPPASEARSPESEQAPKDQEPR